MSATCRSCSRPRGRRSHSKGTCDSSSFSAGREARRSRARCTWNTLTSRSVS
jgi:hypothetical protein